MVGGQGCTLSSTSEEGKWGPLKVRMSTILPAATNSCVGPHLRTRPR